MRPTRDDTELLELLCDQTWLKRVARKLVARDADAEDLAQDVAVRALESGGTVATSGRGWLARVAFRERARTSRVDGARRRREAASEHRGTVDPVDETLERIALQRTIARLVLDLPPAQREVVVLRFWEDLPPRKIAKRLGLELEACKSRLKRGLAALRSGLDDASDGDRTRWLTALAPLAFPRVTHLASTGGRMAAESARAPLGVAPSIAGVALLSTAVLKFAVPLAVVTGVVLFSVQRGGAGDSVVANSETEAASRADAASSLATVAPVADDRTAIDSDSGARAAAAGTSDAPVAPDVAPGSSGTLVVRGRLVDAHGAALADLAVGDVASDEPTALTTTDADGEFEIDADGAVRAGVVDDEWTTVLAASPVPATSEVRVTAVAAPAITLAGRVVDGWGAPVEGASVELLTPIGRQRHVAYDLDHSVPRTWRTESDEDGAFRIDVAPSLEGASLVVACDGHPSYDQPAPLVTREDMWIVLSGPEDGDGVLDGVVVDPSGAPVAGANVGFGLEVAVTGSDGRFALPLADDEGFNVRAERFLGEAIVPGELVATAPGHQPGRYRAKANADGTFAWPERVVVRLGPEALTLRGRVVDEAGVPVAGAEVWVDDPTLVGIGASGPVVLEEQAIVDEGDDGVLVRTDADGEFELGAMSGRAYRIVGHDPDTLLRTAAVTAEAGAEDVVLRLPPNAVWSELRGRVVDRNGDPVPDVTIAVTSDTQKLRVEGRVVSTLHSRRDDEIVTDSIGTFELPTVPRRGVYLRLDGPNIVPDDWGRSANALEEMLASPERVEIVVGIRRRFRVVLREPERADQVAALDADGNTLSLSLMMGNGRRDGPSMPLIDGESGVLTVADSIATIVLSREGEEVQRFAVELEGTDVRELRL